MSQAGLVTLLQDAESVLSVPERSEDVLLPRRDDGDGVGDEQRRLFLGDTPHMAANQRVLLWEHV